MYLDIAHDGVALHQPEVTSDLYASYFDRLAPTALNAILAEHTGGELLPDGAHIMVPIESLRRLAADRVPEGWDADFDKMIEYARSQGWLSDDGASVRAHLERER